MASAEVFLESLDLFSKEPALLSVQKFFFERIPTKTQLDDASLTQFEISAPLSREMYTDLANSFLFLKVKLVKADNTNIAAAPEVGVINYPVGTIFRSVDISMNNARITPLEDEYGYISYLTNFFKPKEAKKGYLTAGLWYEDGQTAATCENPDPQSAANGNAGLKTRASYFASSTEVELIGKINAAPHNGTRLFPCFCAFDWKFTLNEPSFYIMTNVDPAATAYKLKVTAAEMFLKRVDVNPAIRMAHTAILQKRNFHYPLHYVSSRPRNIPNGSEDFQWPGLFSGGDIPSSILVIFVATEAKNGALKRNPFYLQAANIQNLQLNIGSRTIPASNFDANVGANRTLLNYWQSIAGLGYHWGSDVFSGNWGRVAFQNTCFIAVFDLTRDENPRANYINTSFVTEQINLSGKFRAAITENLTCLAFGHFHATLEIDSSYRPICSW